MTQHLAHFNWATLRAPEGDPRVQEFFDGVPRVNGIAERSKGFVWRHGSEDTGGRAIGWPLFDDGLMIASFSVWETPAAFWHFVQNTLHGRFLRRGDNWFTENVSYKHALWWVEAGVIPSMEEARNRVEALRANGPSDLVFTAKQLQLPA